ncbi:MAG: ATPase [Rhizobiales bacterium 62-17]|nr:ParA family protein [Hyphomicrobiales bacterium]OJY03893.1 MAG: ATPase [Rhizobiales bacterium 62-17]
MRIIALVTQKGGSGKSTIASSLAVAAAETGETVIVVDMDPQASLTRWAKVREEKNIGVTTFTPGKLASAVAAMEKAGVTTVIIDTPGTDSPASQAAMKVADICIIPARPNVFDLWASESTRKQLRALRREYAFLLNQCPPAQQSARVEQGAKALEAMGGLLNPMIASRVDYQEASRLGLGVTELHPSSEAAEEIRKLWSSLKRRIGKSTPARRAA